MNKKLASIALSGAMLVSGASFGMDFDPKFYVGAEAQYNKLKGDKNFSNAGQSLLRKKNSPGADLFLGTRITENFGAEVGYSVLKRSHNNLTGGQVVNVKMNNPHVDAIGYIPVGNDVELIGSVGLGRLSTKVDNKVNGVVTALTANDKSLTKTKTGIRLGLGAQYKFSENVGARFMVRHQKGNKIIKNVNSAGLGLFCQF